MGIKLHVLDMGRMRIDKNVFMNQAVAATRDNPCRPNEFMEFPVVAYLIETGNGYILFDTGCNPLSMGGNGRWSPDFQNRCPFFGGAENSVINRLKERGLTPEDVTTVILSHMHNDHAGCVEYFKKSQFIVSRTEFAAAMTAYATHDYMSSYIWKDIDEWIRTKMNWTFVEPDEGDVKLMPGLTILNFGAGHTSGVLGLLLELKNTGAIILTSDAIYCRESYEKMKEPGSLFDLSGWLKTARRVHRLADEYNAQVWFGHDMTQFHELMQAEREYYD